MNPAGAFPVLGKERRRIRFDLNDVPGFMGVGAAPLQEMTELIRRHMATPETRRTDLDTGLGLTVGALVQQNAGGMGFTFDHCGYNAPIRQIADSGRRCDVRRR